MELAVSATVRSGHRERHASLDTLRAFAILTVVLAHSVLAYGAPDSLAPLQLGGSGVALFFVLSGWLLGSLLFREMDRTGRIDVLRFWRRRWWRTLPAYYVVLALTVAQQWLSGKDDSLHLDYVLLVQNYSVPLEIFYVSWSLAVEEQFYLLIAPCLAILGWRHRSIVAAALLFMIAMVVSFRTLGWYGAHIETHVQVDGCLMGVGLALLARRYPSSWSRLCAIAIPVACFATLVYVGFYVFRYLGSDPGWSPPRLALLAVFCAWVVYANSSQTTRKRFSLPGAHYVATRSYAMYLLHPEALALFQRVAAEWHFTLFFAGVLVVTALLSEGLYRFVERPFMALRDRRSPSAV